MPNRYFYTKPFRTMVAFGDSNVYGHCASQEDYKWVNVVAAQIAQFQDESLEFHNCSVSGSVVSSNSPGYDASSKPSLAERYLSAVEQFQPDLILLAFGLNDMRCGNPVESFIADYEKVVRDMKARLPQSVIVLVAPYYQTAYHFHAPFDKGTPGAHRAYIGAIADLAERTNSLFADVHEAMEGADWAVHQDAVHMNDLGMRLVGNRVFEAIARSCRGLGLKAQRTALDLEADAQWLCIPAGPHWVEPEGGVREA